MSTRETRSSPKEVVLSRHPRADVVFEKPVHAFGQSAPIDQGGWVVYSAPMLGARILGRGATADDAWTSAAAAAPSASKSSSPGFKDWLEAQARELATEDVRRREVETWRADVADLREQIKRWLAEEDALKVLKLEEDEIEIHEEGGPPYKAAMLRVGLGPGRFVSVKPIGRNVVGSVGGFGREGFRSQGRVDLTGSIGRYMLHRAFSESGRIWLMVDDDDGRVRLWNKENFEAALQELL